MKRSKRKSLILAQLAGLLFALLALFAIGVLRAEEPSPPPKIPLAKQLELTKELKTLMSLEVAFHRLQKQLDQVRSQHTAQFARIHRNPQSGMLEGALVDDLKKELGAGGDWQVDENVQWVKPPQQESEPQGEAQQQPEPDTMTNQKGEPSPE